MKVITCRDENELALQADQWLQNKTDEYHARKVLLPSGGTPKNLYAMWEKTKPAYLEALSFTQLDEVVTGAKAGCFTQFFREHLPTYFRQFTSLQLEEGPVDLVVLGLGTNGHVAFHEPHMPADFSKGYVDLDAETCARLGLEKGTKGLSFGAGFFKTAKAILLIIQGPGKESVSAALLNDPKANFPAALLRDHSDFTIIYTK